MTERDIKHENGDFWVHSCSLGYTVSRITGSHYSIADSSYPPSNDGLSLAVARCDFLAKATVKESLTVRQL